MSTTLLEAPTTSIYALADPNGEVRYVGKTIDPLWLRFSNHKSAARRGVDTYVARWLRSLLNDGQEPSIMLLEEIPPGGDWGEAERVWIRQMRSFGCRLTNTAVGGAAGNTKKASPETRRKISESLKRHCADPAARARLASITNRKPPTGKGEKNNFARFTEAQVVEMRERRQAGEKLSVIAAAFGTNNATVHGIVTGRQWKHVGGPIQQITPKRKLTNIQIVEIRCLAKEGVGATELARRYGVTQSHVSDICAGRRRLSIR